MKRTFFIVVLAIFFTFDIFFAISAAVADNLKSSPNVEIVHPSESKKLTSGNDKGVINPLPMTIFQTNFL